jgi:hypothetical protein
MRGCRTPVILWKSALPRLSPGSTTAPDNPAAQGSRPGVETELAALLLGAMAARAARLEDRLDVALPVGAVRCPPRERGPEKEGRDERRSHGRVPFTAF